MAKRIYVGNLPYGIQKEELEQLFAEHGEVVSASIITDRYTGKSRGFGFVEMENAEPAIEALNGKEVGGRTLTVNEARPRQNRD